MEISNLKQIGERLADLRDILGFTTADMAKFTDTKNLISLRRQFRE